MTKKVSEQSREGTATTRKSTVVASMASVVLLMAWPHLAGATGPGAKGLSPTVEANVAMEGPVRTNLTEDVRVITTHITIAPLGHTAWHSHPGPHFVSIRTGAAEVYETDCSIRGTFGIGEGFFDSGSTSPSHVQGERDIHTLRNPSSTDPLEVIITDIREHGAPPTVVAQPQPPSCF
ncbi:MAG: hypothetical protein H0U53_09840 [Actinobacteria bacterium]|nr:hypothetical protein [Actinomycetota bacterium]